MTHKQYETEVMAHRYLYYVLSNNIISDAEYDVLERKAREVCPPESPVHGIGSSLPSSYTTEHYDRAMQIAAETE